MKKLILILFLWISSAHLYGQKIAEIDLVRSASSAPVDYYNDVPKGCTTPRYSHSDGEIKHLKSALNLELRLSGEPKLKLGETVQATVLLRNTGEGIIEIPWSSDPLTRREANGTIRHEHDEGWFDVELRGLSKTPVPLETESVSTPLYSSVSVPGSSLRIKPGQWIAAKLSFVLEEERKLSVLLPIEAGSAELRVEWRQVRFTWEGNGCEVQNGYYNHRYREERKAVAVEVAK